MHDNNQRAKSVGDLRKFEQLPIQTGVSVRALVSEAFNFLFLLNEK